MRVRRHPPALVCYALALSQAFWGLGCQDRISGSGAGASSTVAGVLASQDIGAVVFALWREQVTREPAGPGRDARLAALDGRRADFVRAVNDIVNVRTVQGVAQTADALFALVDDGTLPALADHAAAVVDLLLQDPRALDALVDLARQQPRGSHAAIPPRELIGLLGRVANYPDSEALWTAVARLIDENDGRDAQGNPNGEPTLVPDLLALARDALNRAATASPTATQGQLLQAVGEVLGAMTEEAQVRGTFDFGHPEWVARVDARGLPRVAADPATGRPFAPFVDQDGDGLADADAAGAFVDAAGQLIDRPVFGRPGDPGFDAEGRAVTGGGALLYEYVDAKRTILALTAKLAGDLLAREVDERGCRVLEAGLGPLQADGTYGRDHPVADLAWGGLELLADDALPALLRASQHLLQRDPAAAERLIVTLARGHEAARSATRGSTGLGARLSDPRMVQLVDDLMPIIDDVLEQPSNGGRSTGLVLVDTLIELRTRAPDFGPQLAPLFLFRQVVRETVPDGDRNDVDEARSTPVDHAQPAWIGGQDNRSAVHQLLDLLARNDGCQLFGRSMAVWIIDQMADLSPATVGTLATLVTSLPGFLTNLFCPGTSQDIQALDALARSGALDGFLPLAKAFKDQGETELLVRLLVRLQRSYDGTLRGIERDVAAILDAGALEELEAALELARQVRDPLTNEPATETIARALGDLVDVDRVVHDRRGQRVPSRAHLLLRPLQELDRRVVAAGRAADLTAVAEGLFEVVFAREVVNGVELLRNGSTIPLAARALDAFAAALPADAATRRAEVDLARAQLEDALASKDLAVVLQLLRTIEASPHKQTIRRSIVNLLTPNRAVQHDIFGAVVRLSVIACSLPRGAMSLAPFQDIAPFLARVVDPQHPVVPDTLRAIERLLTADQGQTTLNLVRAALNPAPGEVDPPAAVLLDVVQEVSAAGGGSGGALDRAALEEGLRWLAAFIRDDVSGLGYLFALITGRQR
ncbi:MAG: hypothetical protein M9894_01475 [Planctomycetes bacterium]|nr:hypothetical protein [Planctomycetota bacterium]